MSQPTTTPDREAELGAIMAQLDERTIKLVAGALNAQAQVVERQAMRLSSPSWLADASTLRQLATQLRSTI